MRFPFQHAFALTLIALALSTVGARAGDDNDIRKTGHAVNDEIQVYIAEIAKVGQWTLQQQWPEVRKGAGGGPK
jgi:hypothetical protein